MKTRIVFMALLLAAGSLFAAQPLFPKYEAGRQALLGGSLPAIRTAAGDLAAAARAQKQTAVATKAEAVAASPSLGAARTAFAALSEEMVRYRATQKGQRPVVAYCSMEKKSWLQPAGPISNPYVDAGMRSCGEVTAK